jgi:hypothetical protein
MDLADGRILGNQFHLAPPQLGNVAAKNQRTEPVLLVTKRNGPQRQAYAA